MAADWRLAKALTKLRDQINALEPTRDKTSDGTIGDAAHQATKSEHNPNRFGVVLAFDCTHDPLDGVDCNVLAAALIDSRDSRISYVIWNKGMWRAYAKPNIPAWTRAEYHGPNPHDHHLHISLVDDDDGIDALYDLQAPWALPADLSATDAPLVPIRTLRKGDTDPGVLWIRERLHVHGFTCLPPATTTFTDNVDGRVRAFQERRRLNPDGIVGKLTRDALRAAPVLVVPPAPPPIAQPTLPGVQPTPPTPARRGWCDRALEKFPF